VRLNVPVNPSTPTVPLWAGQTPSSDWTNVAAQGSSPITTSYFWIGIRMVNSTPPFDIKFRYLLFNSVSAHNALTIPLPETLGTSDGAAFQSFLLQHQPLFAWPGRIHPYDHLVVTVNDAPWTQTDEFPKGPATSYRLDPVAGQITFGNYDPTTPAGQLGRGSIPPANAIIKATSYRYVAGGTSGNVAPGILGNLSAVLPNVIGVTNLLAATGGTDEEPIKDTLRRAPNVLQNQNRAVSPSDYEFLVHNAFPALSTVRCLPPLLQTTAGPNITVNGTSVPAWNVGDPWTFGGIDRSPGNVNVIIVADQGPDVLSPKPTQDQLFDVARFLDGCRDVSVRLKVYAPCYVPVAVTADLKIFATAIVNGTDPSQVKTDTLNKVVAFLHPTEGGPNGQGWQIGQNVYLVDLFQAIMLPADVGYIATLSMQMQTPLYFDANNPNTNTQRPGGAPSTAQVASVRLFDYELVCSVDGVKTKHNITAEAE
jgi:predicted phage baseplate assembly protein